jgi:para-aminobenzoate synthetase component 2
MILLIDNYDSFVFNLARYCRELHFATTVVRNDALSIADIIMLNPSHIILSPGPCTPDEAGITIAVIQHFSGVIPILGVCLGHQAIAQAFGGVITRAKSPLHGKSTAIKHHQQAIFAGLSNPLQVGRYHSLIVSNDHFPDKLAITAESTDGEIMACQHLLHQTFGVQFHPESILTPEGKQLLNNFLTL